MELFWQAIYEKGRARWPTIALSASEFASWTEQWTQDSDSQPRETRSEELYVTAGCLQGNSAALAIFAKDYLEPTRSFIARFSLSEADWQDIIAKVREKLLVKTPNEVARLADYQGFGSLRVWVFAIVARDLISLGRSQRLHEKLHKQHSLFDMLDDADPEIALLKKNSREVVKQAFEAALAKLSVRERLLLRMHILDQLSIDEIGRAYAVNRVTAARWLEKARSNLSRFTRQDLVASLGQNDDDIDSLLRAAHSQLDLSLHRLLATQNS